MNQPPPLPPPPPPPPQRREWKAWQIVLIVIGSILGLGVLAVVTFVGLVYLACSGKC